MKRTQQSDQTKNTILDAANRVLTQKGAEGFTLEAVAAEAGVSKGGLLYHFTSKDKLISGMIERSIALVDAALEEELVRSNGDYLSAYICASFRTTADPEQVSRAMQAAFVRDPALLTPIRERFLRMHKEITQHAPSPELGLLVRLSMDGLWLSEQLRFAPPDETERNNLRELLLDIVNTQSKNIGEKE